jgi:DNA-binding PadR family transcriptional regulator
MKRDITNAEAALLGLLHERPKHPYEIEKDVEYRDMRAWTDLSMSSIYKLLRKLEKDALVSSESVVSDQNRARRIYRPTTEGSRAFADKIHQMISDRPDLLKDPFNVGIYNSAILPRKRRAEALTSYRNRLNELLKGHRELEKFLRDSNCTPHHVAVATRAQFILQAEIKWIDTYLPTLTGEK